MLYTSRLAIPGFGREGAAVKDALLMFKVALGNEGTASWQPNRK
jgi:UDP-glucose 6-dehydrogenase